MQKKLTLLIFIMFNLNIYTQVVIKDEIVLVENDNPDYEYMVMPFYGKVSGNVNTGSIINGSFRKVSIEAGGQTRVVECPCGFFCQYIYPS